MIQRDASLAAFAHIFPPELYPYPFEDVSQRWEEALGDERSRCSWPRRTERPPVWPVVAPSGSTASTFCRSGGAAAWDGRSTTRCSKRLRADGSARCHLWVLEHNDRARRFYERLGWHENGDSRVVPFPPNPIDLGYSIEL